jgi:hypothetical protein
MVRFDCRRPPDFGIEDDTVLDAGAPTMHGD